ncbi:MAG: hypothetical protein OHK0029_03170 [Armatimonadaceae bacterium]
MPLLAFCTVLLGLASTNMVQAQPPTGNPVPGKDKPVVPQAKLLPTPDYAEAMAAKPSVAVRVVHQRGDQALARGENQEAAKAYLEAALQNPRDPVLRLSAGVMLAEIGKIKEATEQFRQALRRAEDDVVTALLLQNALIEQGAGAEAHEIYQDTYRRFGQTQQRGLDVSTSVRRLKEALTVYGESPVYYLLLGDAYQLGEQWSDADRAYRRAFVLAPRWSKPLVNLGISQLAQGQLKESIEKFEQALKLDPRNKQAQLLQMTGQGQVYANARSYKQAINTLKSAQQIAPKDPTPSLMIAQIQADNGNHAAAAGAYETALRITRSGGLFAQRPVVYRSLAEAYLSGKEPEKAIAALQKALTEEPAEAALWYRLMAQAQFAQGKSEAAKRSLIMALDSEAGPYPLDTLRAIDAASLLTEVKERYRAERTAAESGIRATPQGNGVVSITMANPRERTVDNRVKALVALAHIARYEQAFREEVRLRFELTRLRTDAWDWYLMAETYDQSLREPISARDAYLKALEISIQRGGLNSAAQDYARQRLNILTAPAYKP